MDRKLGFRLPSDPPSPDKVRERIEGATLDKDVADFLVDLGIRLADAELALTIAIAFISKHEWVDQNGSRFSVPSPFDSNLPASEAIRMWIAEFREELTKID